MPLNNNFYGVYKVIKINTASTQGGSGSRKPYIIENFDANNSMEASAKFYMQGSPLTRVLDIGAINEKYNVSAPILVPADGIDFTTLKDGAQLLNEICYLQYTQDPVSGVYVPNNKMPLLVSAELLVSSQSSKITFDLQSDGDPNNSANIYQIDTGYNSALGLDKAARVAKNWDFAVQFGDLKYYVEEIKVDIKIETKPSNFLGSYSYVNQYGGNTVPYDGLNGGVWSDAEPYIGSYTGWQFPFYSIGGVQLTASGKAVVSLANDVTVGPNINYNYLNINNPITTRAAMFAGPNATYPGYFNVSAQQPGEFTYAAGTSFSLYRLKTTGGATANSSVSLGPSLLPNAFSSFNNSLITSKNIRFSADKLTFDFEVKAFVTQ